LYFDQVRAGLNQRTLSLTTPRISDQILAHLSNRERIVSLKLLFRNDSPGKEILSADRPSPSIEHCDNQGTYLGDQKCKVTVPIFPVEGISAAKAVIRDFTPLRVIKPPSKNDAPWGRGDFSIRNPVTSGTSQLSWPLTTGLLRWALECVSRREESRKNIETYHFRPNAEPSLRVVQGEGLRVFCG
jgi:hypothetical protein